MTTIDYEKDMQINEFKLPEEWIRQPQLYMKYAELCADAKKEFDEVWEKVKIKRAELIKEANENGAKNDSQREAYFRTNKEFKKLKQEKIDAEKTYNILNHVMFALAHRKAALENLVRMSLSEFYSTPTVEPTKEGENFNETVKKKTARDKIKSRRRSK